MVAGLFISPAFPANGKPRDLNVVLITIDALRADHLGCYGYKRNTSPNIDRLAREGALFTQAIAQSSCTPPSMGAIATSTYPRVNGLRGWGYSIRSDLPTLAEILQAHGYKTICATEAPTLRHGLRGFVRGFDKFYDEGLITEDPAPAWPLEKDCASPFFLWIHYMRAHDYNPKKKLENAFMNDSLYDKRKKLPIVKSPLTTYVPNRIPSFWAEQRGGIDNPDYYVALYDAGILSVDEQIGLLVQKLEKTARGRNTLFILTADHGEMMGEHGFYFQHGNFVYEPLIKVPFILYSPGIIPAKKIDAQIRASLDVFPTILGYLKIEKPKAFEGVNLLPALLGEDVGSFPYVISEDGNLSVRTGHWKLIHSENNALSETYALFNLKNDPGEKVDLASVEKRKFAVLKEKMDEYRKNFPETSVLPPELNEEARAALRALGYLQ